MSEAATCRGVSALYIAGPGGERSELHDRRTMKMARLALDSLRSSHYAASEASCIRVLYIASLGNSLRSLPSLVASLLVPPHLAKDGLAVGRHLLLLGDRTVILEGENHRVLGGNKAVVLDGLDDVLELDLSSQSVSVENDGIALWPVPAVKLDTPAPLGEVVDVPVHRGVALELVGLAVSVVRGRTPVVRDGLVHILVDGGGLLDGEGRVRGRREVVLEVGEAHLVVNVVLSGLGGSHLHLR